MLAGALVLFAGCSSPSRPRAVVSNRVVTGDGRSAGPQDDYSPGAVEARIESHARFAAGIIHDLNEEPSAAAEEFLKAALADLGNEDLVADASTRLIRLKKTDQAIDLLTRAAGRPDASATIFARLGLAYSIAGKRDLAIEANRKAIRKNPGDITGYQYLAQLHLQNSQADEGLKVLEEAGKHPKADATYLIELGETYIMFVRAGKTSPAKERALETFGRAVKLKPANPLLLQRLADGFHALGESGRASELYAQILERVPKAPGVRERLVDILLLSPRRTNAIPHLRVLAGENPTSTKFNFYLGALLSETRQPKEAAEYMKKALQYNLSFEPAYYELAAAQLNLGQPKAALESLEKARKRFDKSFVGEYYTGLAYSHKELKDHTNALKFFASAEKIAGDKETNRLTHTFYFQLGAASERAHQFKQAEDYFRKCLALSPDFAEALNYLGYMWADRGENLQEAHEMIEKAVKMEPKNAAFLDSLGWVLFKLDKPHDALKWIQKAIEHIEEPDATLYEHLGDILIVLNKPAEARQAFQRAYSIEPSEQIQRKLNTATPGPAPR